MSEFYYLRVLGGGWRVFSMRLGAVRWFSTEREAIDFTNTLNQEHPE